jgi:hypothetical protein
MLFSKEALRNNRIDPYAAWAQATNFAYLSGTEAGQLPVLIESTSNVKALATWCDGFAKAELSITPIYLSLPGAEIRRICTGRMSKSFFDEIHSNKRHDFWEMVERFELAMHVSPALERSFQPPSPGLGGLLEQRSTIIGVVDVGCAYANKRWRDRIAALWRQDADSDGNELPASDTRYGREWVASGEPRVIEPLRNVSSVIDEENSYRRFGFGAALAYRSHGAAVLGQIADGHDLRIPILAVELPHATVSYSARSALSAHVFDGVAWILARGRRDADDTSTRFVINVSMGTQAGPHDGSSILERGFDELIDAYRSPTGERLAIVLAAGNSYEARCHAELDLKRGKPATLALSVPPDDLTPSYVEVWCPTSVSNDLKLTLIDPTGRECGVTAGTQAQLKNVSAKTAAMIVFPNRSAGGDRRGALIAIAPTVSGVAAHGRWLIKLESSEAVSNIHIYVERDNSMFDPARRRGRQTTLLHAIRDTPGRHTTRSPDVAHESDYIRRDGTLNSIATGLHTIVVGSYVHRERKPSRYSRQSAS